MGGGWVGGGRVGLGGWGVGLEVVGLGGGELGWGGGGGVGGFGAFQKLPWCNHVFLTSEAPLPLVVADTKAKCYVTVRLCAEVGFENIRAETRRFPRLGRTWASPSATETVWMWSRRGATMCVRTRVGVNVKDSKWEPGDARGGVLVFGYRLAEHTYPCREPKVSLRRGDAGQGEYWCV